MTPYSSESRIAEIRHAIETSDGGVSPYFRDLLAYIDAQQAKIQKAAEALEYAVERIKATTPGQPDSITVGWPLIQKNQLAIKQCREAIKSLCASQPETPKRGSGCRLRRPRKMNPLSWP